MRPIGRAGAFPAFLAPSWARGHGLGAQRRITAITCPSNDSQDATQSQNGQRATTHPATRRRPVAMPAAPMPRQTAPSAWRQSSRRRIPLASCRLQRGVWRVWSRRHRPACPAAESPPALAVPVPTRPASRLARVGHGPRRRGRFAWSSWAVGPFYQLSGGRTVVDRAGAVRVVL